MARELVTENGVAESAAAVWRQIQAEYINVFIPAAITPEPVVKDSSLTKPLAVPVFAISLEGLQVETRQIQMPKRGYSIQESKPDTSRFFDGLKLPAKLAIQ